MTINIKQLLIITTILLLTSSCSRMSLVELIKPPKAFNEAKIPPAPDYSDINNWHETQRRGSTKEIDVFYLHPTTYILGKDWNQHLQNEHVNWRTEVLPIAYQASTFFDDCRMFIPKYRQAIFYSFVDKKGSGKKALELAYQDVRAAFYYYLEHNNKGKPFVFASHSQGSYLGQQLLAEVLQDSSIKAKMLVAYVIGWPVTQTYLNENSSIEVCSTSTQTACIVSWNTESGNPKLSLTKEFADGEAVLCVNPLSWTLDTNYVAKTENKGSLQYNKRTDEDEIILYYCDAKIENGALKITPPANQKQLQMPMGKGNYHLYDYNFFYQNIKQNVRDRMDCYNKNLGEIVN